MNTPSFLKTIVIALVANWAWSNALPNAMAQVQDKYETAPPKHAVLSSTLNGWFFVPKELKTRYDKTLKELESLQTNVELGHVSADEAQRELDRHRTSLRELRKLIEASRVHVDGAKIHEQTESTEFTLGPEQRLAITTNQVHIIGWDKPYVKADLRKLVLAPDKQPIQDHLDDISIEHTHGRAEFAGKTDAEWEAEEQKYLETDGANLTPEQRLSRKKFVDEIRNSYYKYRDYVGKPTDHITVAGLEYDHNSSITLSAKSEGGDGQSGSVRQRYAELTVFVPKCITVCVRGAERGLIVENLESDLIITPEGSTDSDERGRFEINGLHGNLTCSDFPLSKIANVKGHVTYTSTLEFGVEGGGLSYLDNQRNMKTARPFAMEIQNVSNGVQLHTGRIRLALSNIGGTVDVLNEFGSTTFKSDSPLPQTAHRLVSYSGKIEAEFSQSAWDSIPIATATNHGGIQTNTEREVFEDFYLEGVDSLTNTRRNWYGFRKPLPKADHFATFELVKRFPSTIRNEERTPGFDIISRAGVVVILKK